MNLIGQAKILRLDDRYLFEILNDTFSKLYNHSENVAIDEIIVPSKGG
jgi:hypothetical protein